MRTGSNRLSIGRLAGSREQGAGQNDDYSLLRAPSSMLHVMQPVLFLLLLVSSALCLVPSYAEDISFEAAVEPQTIAMGTTGRVVLTLHGSQDLKEALLPAVDGFDVRYVGPSSKVLVVNGAYSSSKSFTYMLIPLREGKFTIPSVDVTIAGQTYSSKPLVVDVVEASQASSSGDPTQDPKALAEKIKLLIGTPRKQCYVNEEFPVFIKLYVRDVPLRDISLPEIRQDGFVLSDFEQPRQYEEDLDGVRFNVVEFRAQLTPLKEGNLMLGPAVLTGNILVENQNSMDSPRGGLFGDDLFSTFFGGTQKRPLTISAKPVALSVLDLPSENVPAGFNGAVGRFTFSAQVTPVSVPVGDPLTLKITVAGIGNLRSVKLPLVNDEHFKTYDPQEKDGDGDKTLEQVLIPLDENISQVPALSFSYFDTAVEKYVTLKQGPFPVKVTPPQKGAEFQAVAFADRPVSLVPEKFGQDIVFIKDLPGNWHKKGLSFSVDTLFYVLLIVYLHVWGALLGIFLYRRYLHSDEGMLQRVKAYRQMRVRWKAAAALITLGQERAFYDELIGAFYAYCSAKLGKAPGALDLHVIDKELSLCQIESKELSKLQEVLKTADEVRFAGTVVDIKKMKSDYLDIEEVIEAIERRVK